jgi:hypothetical protein
MAITIISYPDNQINESIVEPTSLLSNEMVQNVWVNVAEATTDTYIEIVFNGVTTTLLITDECRYTPIDICFQNKEGALQFMTFFKARTDSLSVTNEEFEGDRGQPLDGNHQYVKFNVQGKSKFKVNSGFIEESMNETVRQLLLSERVWMYSNEIFTPLNVAGKSLEYKTRQKDRLINYEIEFDYAFNEINSI